MYNQYLININNDYYNVEVTHDAKMDRFVIYYDNAKDFNITYWCNDGDYERIILDDKCLEAHDYIKEIIECDMTSRKGA